MIPNLQNRSALSVTINTTEDCNLRCKYCYETNKRNKSIPLDYAKRFLDILINEDPDPVLAFEADEPDTYVQHIYDRGITLDFIGGDSLIDVSILEDIIQYFIYLLNTSSSPNALRWRDNWRLSLSSNGTLFEREDVRAFCEKYKKVLALGVSIDGCPKLHDLNRVYPDGSGSMETILKWWPWYKKNFPEESLQTKATAARDSIPYLRDSLEFMHETLGLQYISHNFIMEDMNLQPADLTILDSELARCVDYVLEHRHDLYWGMLNKTEFAEHHLSSGTDWSCKGHCGSGAMPALSVNGNIYPCFRFLPHTQNGQEDVMKVGDIFKGLYAKENFRVVRQGAYRSNCTVDPKCIDCEYESACSYCIGGCYAEFGSFKRTTYICEVTKLLCKWAKYYWDRYKELEK